MHGETIATDSKHFFSNIHSIFLDKMDVLVAAINTVEKKHPVPVFMTVGPKKGCTIRVDLSRYPESKRKGGTTRAIYTVKDDYVIRKRVLTCKQLKCFRHFYTCSECERNTHHSCKHRMYVHCLECK